MSAAPFFFPYRHFPGRVRRIATADSACLLFAETGTDAGLRHACHFYWNAKKITLAVSGSAISRNYLAPVWPATLHTASDMAWGPWEKTYTQYAADAAAVSLIPLATTLEAAMHPPCSRIYEAEYYLAGTNPIDRLAGRVLGEFAIGTSTPTHAEVLWLTCDALEIVWSTTHDRYALRCALSTTFQGTDSTDESDVHYLIPSASLKAEDYTLADGETAAAGVADLTLPDCLELAGAFVLTPPSVLNPNTSAMEYLDCAIALEMSVEFWVYP